MNQPNFLMLNRRDKQWSQCLQRAFAAHNDLFEILAPTISNNANPEQIPNATIYAHPPGQPNVQIPHTITFVDFMGDDRMGGDRSNWDELASRHVDGFVKIYRKRFKDQIALAEARKQDHLP